MARPELNSIEGQLYALGNVLPFLGKVPVLKDIIGPFGQAARDRAYEQMLQAEQTQQERARTAMEQHRLGLAKQFDFPMAQQGLQRGDLQNVGLAQENVGRGLQNQDMQGFIEQYGLPSVARWTREGEAEESRRKLAEQQYLSNLLGNVIPYAGYDQGAAALAERLQQQLNLGGVMPQAGPSVKPGADAASAFANRGAKETTLDNIGMTGMPALVRQLAEWFGGLGVPSADPKTGLTGAPYRESSPKGVPLGWPMANAGIPAGTLGNLFGPRQEKPVYPPQYPSQTGVGQMVPPPNSRQLQGPPMGLMSSPPQTGEVPPELVAQMIQILTSPMGGLR